MKLQQCPIQMHVGHLSESFQAFMHFLPPPVPLGHGLCVVVAQSRSVNNDYNNEMQTRYHKIYFGCACLDQMKRSTQTRVGQQSDIQQTTEMVFHLSLMLISETNADTHRHDRSRHHTMGGCLSFPSLVSFLFE